MWISEGLCTGFSTVCTQVFGGYAQGAALHAGAFPAAKPRGTVAMGEGVR